MTGATDRLQWLGHTALAKDPSLVPSSSKLPITTALGNPIPSSGLWATIFTCTQTHEYTSLAFIIIIIINVCGM